MSHSRTLVWFVWLTASIFYAYQFLLKVMPSIMMPEIMEKFAIDSALFGQFSGVYYIGYALVHIPMGLLLDHYGPRKVMSICIVLTVIGSLPVIFSNHWVYPVIGRALVGIGSSAAILGVFKIIRMNFDNQHFTRMLSLSVMIGLIGGIYGGGPLSYMSHVWGYETVIQLFAFIGIVLAAVTYLIIPDMESSHRTTVFSDLKTVFTNKKVIQICIFSGFMVGPLEGFADIWGATFLKQVYGLEMSLATTLPSMIFIGMCFGSPILSLIAEKTGYYLGAIIGAGLLMALIFIALLLGAFTTPSISIAFLVVGMCCAYQILAIYKASTYVSPEVSGLTSAVANMIITSFGYAFHSAIGFVVNTYGGPGVTQSLVYGIGVIPVGLMIGVVGLIGLAYQQRSGRLVSKS